jgi:hypothetical protein
MRRGRRTFQRLQEYWLEKDLLGEEDIAAGPQGDGGEKGGRPLEEGPALPRGKPLRRKVAGPALAGWGSGPVWLPLRYVLGAAGLVALLLVVVAILSTVLVMQSCQRGAG